MNAADLQKFCADEDDIRPYLRQPWSSGEWTYATNGHILVRVKRLADVHENVAAPNAQKLLDAAKIGEWLKVPETAEPPEIACDECNGTGEVECPTCGHEDKCDDCCGTGMVRETKASKVGAATFNDHYLAMIQGWEIATTTERAAAPIRNGEADGLLMPIRPEAVGKRGGA